MAKQDLSRAPEGYSQVNWDNMTDKDKKVVLRQIKLSGGILNPTMPSVVRKPSDEDPTARRFRSGNPVIAKTSPSLDSQPPVQAQPEHQYQTPEQQPEAQAEVQAPALPTSSLSREAFREEIRRKTATIVNDEIIDEPVNPLDAGQAKITKPFGDANDESMEELINPLDAGELAVQEAGGHIQEIGNEDKRKEEAVQVVQAVQEVQEVQAVQAQVVPYVPVPAQEVVIPSHRPGETLFLNKNMFKELKDDERITVARQEIDESGVNLGKMVRDIARERYADKTIPSSKIREIANYARNHAVAHVVTQPEDFDYLARIAEGFADENLAEFIKDNYADGRTTIRLKAQKSKKGGLLGLIAGAVIVASVGLGGIVGYVVKNGNNETAKAEVPTGTYYTMASGTEENSEQSSTIISGTQNFQKTPDPRENQTTFGYAEENKKPSEAQVPVISYTVKPGNDGNVENVPLEEPEIVKENLTTPKVEIKTESNNPAENFGKEPFAYSTTQEELEERLSNEERELTDVEQARKDMADNYLAQNRFNNIPNPTPYNDIIVPKPVEVSSANWYVFAQGGVKVPILNRKGEEAPNPTWVVEAGVGRKFATGLSLEVKAGHSEYTDTKTEAGNYASIDEVENSVGLGFLYNQPISEDWTLKVGTSGGATFRETNVEFGNSSIPTIQVHDSEVVPYIELNLGAGYNVTKNFSVDLNLSGRTSPEDNAGVTGTATAGVEIKF